MNFDVWTYVARMGSRMRSAADPFFADGDAVCQMRTCQYFVPEDEEELLHQDFQTFECSAPGCKATFNQLMDSEVHYATKHRHSCSVCNKSLPSNHLLELHVQENHDSFFKVLSEKKPSFACFLETCTLKYWTPDERREHGIKSHNFPANFKFDSTKKKAKKATKKLDKKGKKAAAPMEVAEPGEEKLVEPMQISTEEPVKPVVSPNVQLRKFSYGTQKSHDPSAANRRLSLNTYTKQISLDSSTSHPGSPERRGPVSLARMGERLSSNSSSTTSSITRMPAPTSCSANSSPFPMKRMSLDSRKVVASQQQLDDNDFRPRGISISGSKSNIPQLIRNSPNKRQSLPPATRFSSTSSSSPEQSKISSHQPKDQMNNNSPSKSRIPVRTSSVKVPKNICFGFGVKNSFTKRSSHWYQKPGDSTTLKSIEKTKFDDMRMALD